jgi:hypothetical protein
MLPSGPAAAADCDAAALALGLPGAPSSLVRDAACDLLSLPARDEATFTALARALRGGGPGLYLARLRALDLAGHRHGPGTPQARRARRAIDRQLAAVHAALLAGHDHWAMVVVGDHGLARVHATLDPAKALRRAGAREGRDVDLAVAPTLAAAWARTGAGRRALDDVLPTLAGADVVAPGERRALGFEGHAWGDALLAARPGTLLWPSSGATGRGPPLAAHGYLDPGAEGPALAVVASSDRGVHGDASAPRPAVDIAPTVRDLLGAPREPTEGRSWASQPLVRA